MNHKQRRAAAKLGSPAEGHFNLGNALMGQGKLDEAIAAYRRAIGIKPDFADAHSNLGNALAGQGKLDEAIVAYRRAIGIKTGFSNAFSNLLLELNYDDKSRHLQQDPSSISSCMKVVQGKVCTVQPGLFFTLS